jgi:hypothetical protein
MLMKNITLIMYYLMIILSDIFGPLDSIIYFWLTKTNINFVKDHPMNIPTKLWFNLAEWFYSEKKNKFRKQFYWHLLVSHFFHVFPIDKKKIITFKRSIQQTFLPSLVPIGSEKIIKTDNTLINAFVPLVSFMCFWSTKKT